MRKLVLGAAVGLALVACGGGGDDGISFRDPDDVQFTFGTREPVVEDSAEEETAEVGAEGAMSMLDLLGTADGTTMQQLADFVVAAPEALGWVFDPVRRIRGGAIFYPGEIEWEDPGCISVTPQAQIAFDHCRATATGTEPPSEMVSTLNGSLVLNDGHIQWNLTSTWSLSVGGEAAFEQRTSRHLTGSIDVSTIDGTILGSSRTDLYLRISEAGVTSEEAITYNADYDLAYDSDPLCVSGGALTLKRLYSLPVGYETDPNYEDAGVELYWDGCGNVSVAWPVVPDA